MSRAIGFPKGSPGSRGVLPNGPKPRILITPSLVVQVRPQPLYK